MNSTNGCRDVGVKEVAWRWKFISLDVERDGQIPSCLSTGWAALLSMGLVINQANTQTEQIEAFN